MEPARSAEEHRSHGDRGNEEVEVEVKVEGEVEVEGEVLPPDSRSALQPPKWGHT